VKAVERRERKRRGGGASQAGMKAGVGKWV